MPRRLAFWTLLAVSLALVGCTGDPASVARPTPVSLVEVLPESVSLNRVGLSVPAPERYQIIIVGHLYGGIEGEDRDPAKALTARLPELQSSAAAMLVSLGDMVKTAQIEDFEVVEQQLFEKLPFAVFNAPGNHDVEADRALYEARYGQTFYSFRYGTARLIFLDGEREPCALDEQQRTMLASALQTAQSDPETRQILIFLHKTLFFESAGLFTAQSNAAQPNEWLCYGKPAASELMKNLIEPAAAVKPVTIFSGDVGAWGNLTPYYARRSDLPITQVMTGLGDTPSDAGIVVTVSGATLELAIYPLTDKQWRPLESYDERYWLERAGVK